MHGGPGLWGRVAQRCAAAALPVTATLLCGASVAVADPAGQITEFSTGLNQGSAPALIAPGPAGTLWFTDEGTTPAIGKIASSGQIAEFSSGLKQTSSLLGISPGADGNLWFTDDGAKALGRITPLGQITEFSSGLLPGTAPFVTALGADGNLWFTDDGAKAIGRITPSGQITEFTAGLGSGSTPAGIASGPDGNAWFTDESTSAPAIGRITPSGQITEFTGLPSGSRPGRIAPGPDGNLWFADYGTHAIGRITTSGQVKEFNLPPGSNNANYVAPGADGNVWFTDNGTTTKAIGRITPSGQISLFSVGLNQAGKFVGVAPGADGNLWFADSNTPAVGKVGTGAPAALQGNPTLSGAGTALSPETCQNATWATWAGVTPSLTLLPVDGYQWLRDGSPISGQNGASYTPTAADLGHKLACQVTVTYPVPFLVTDSATSVPITIQRPPAPSLSRLQVSPRSLAVTGRLVKGRCRSATPANRRHRHCRLPVALRVSLTLNMPATVSLTADRILPGRFVHRRCKAPTRKNRERARCSRLIRIRGSVIGVLPAGTDGFTWDGSIGGHRLGPGSYWLVATPVANGRTGMLSFVRLTLTA